MARALDVGAGIVSAGPVHAGLSPITGLRITGILRAAPLQADLPLGAERALTADRQADAVHASLTVGAAHQGAGEDAVPVAAEAGGPTLHVGAGIRDAGALQADLLGGAAEAVAVLGAALTLHADLTCGAADVRAAALAVAGLLQAAPAAGAGHARAEREAVLICAEAALRAVALRAAARHAAIHHAALTLGAELPLIHEAVTVIVFAVAALHGHLAADAAGVEQALVDLAIAVIVPPVADLLLGALLNPADDLTREGAGEQPAAAAP